MSENETPEPEHVAPVPVAQPVAPTAAQPVAQPVAQSVEKVPFKNRVLGMKAVAGVAAASLILGGAGGALLGKVSDGGNDQAGFRGGPGAMNGGMNGGQPPAGMQGQQQGDDTH